MKQNAFRATRSGRRLMSALLALALSLSLLPAMAQPAAAADWMEPYLQKLVSWGVMRGDSSGNLHADRPITRAEFVVLVNRAFGYRQTGATLPFRDVAPTDWYYDDINIGYTTGYFNGTSATTASPRASVTREQATVLLGRNLALDNDPGASLEFTDSNNLGTWSRGIVRSAASEGIVNGYGDGSFRPKTNITRGQMAVLLVNAIGTPVNTAGDHSLGGVYGNVTVSTSGVTLRDTTIAGNLYITGGLGLGDINLENVTVLGKIVVCGAGESSRGDNSILLRNVTAPTLILDSLANNIVTLRADGDTMIDNVSVRTPSYLEDATDDAHGLRLIELDGEEGTTLDAAGNLKEIVSKTTGSAVNIAKGSVQVLTVDEAAPGSRVVVSNGAVAKKLNLDVGATVTGDGDVENLAVNSAGSSSTLLPDTITIRPGQTANISGTNMDTTLAAESSADPRLLAGYPLVINVASTSATAQFRTNKAGTLYWALTSLADGSVGEEDLRNPSNNARILKSGNLKAALSNTDYTTALSGLTNEGSYYLSAMLVDARNQQSPVKVTAFTTPDNTAPNFSSGYPYLSRLTNISAQAAVMPTKSCQLYYALLPKGSTAPAAKDFQANAVSGNLGFGSMDVTKNVPVVFTVNRGDLEELKSYDLYLWLTDADSARSSAVRKLSFTTVDGTAPEFVTVPTVTSIKETSIGLTASLNEAGTIFWVAVREGTEYPKPMNGQTTQPTLGSVEAKLQVSNGMNALKSGKVTATANKDVTINITGLTSETAYDIYYVAQDKAGNFSAVVGKLSAHTLDTNPPSVTQEFTRTNDSEGLSPLADTDVRIVFSENVQDKDTNQQLLSLYTDSLDTTKTAAQRAEARTALTTLLRSDIQLYTAETTPASLVDERTDDADTTWTIDYRYATVINEDGKVVVTFPRGTGLNLQSGNKYYFQIQNIADTSNNKNIIRPNPQTLAPFTTVFAQIQLSNTVTSGSVNGADVEFDMSFRAVPVSTGNAGDQVRWDLLFRAAIPVKFELYERKGENGSWTKLPGVGEIASTDGTLQGASFTRSFKTGNSSSSTNAETLRDVKETRYYGIRFTSVNNIDVRATWSGRVELSVEAVAGSNASALHNLAVSNMTDQDLAQATGDGLVQVGSPSPYTMRHSFSDTMVPEFAAGYPQFVPSDVTASINVQLTRTTGRIFYVVAEVEAINTTLTADLAGTGTRLTAANWAKLPANADTPVYSSVPNSGSIMTPPYAGSAILKGSVSYYGSTVSIPLSNLNPERKYVAYFVLQGSSSTVYSSNPYVLGFETTEVSRPIITLDINNPSVTISATSTSNVDYLLAVNGSEPGTLRNLMVNYVSDTDKALFRAGGTYGANYTVLDAMSTDFQDSNNNLQGSVFDRYATESSKNSIAAYIRAQTPAAGSVTLKSSVTVPAGSPVTVDCSSGMSGTTWYTFLAVGKSAAGSGDAFRAIRPVFNTDDTPPMITACNFVLTSVLDSPNAICNGTLTLQFNEDLYWVVRQGTDQDITPINHTTALNPGSGYYPAGLAFEPGFGSGITYVKGSGSGVISRLDFNFQNARPGASITGSAQIGDKSGNVHTIPLSITLRYVSNGDSPTTYSPSFVITPAWDATGR